MSVARRAPTESGREDRSAAYAPRRTEEAALYGAVSEGLETFLARARQYDRCVPYFVERELRAFLECGILAHGFLRVHCDACGHDRLVPYSCKGRGFCPSCGGRRMADTAAHLVDRVLPEVPVRQWVMTLPVALRYRLAYDADLMSAVLREFVRAVFCSVRRRAREGGRIHYPHCGAVTFVQRAGDALNLNVHFHSLVLDGVYDLDPPHGPCFILLPPPDEDELRRVVLRVADRVARLLARRGIGPDADTADADPLRADQPLLAGLAEASVLGRVALGPGAGRRVRRLGDRIHAEAIEDDGPSHCVGVGGFSLHAGVCVPRRDRHRLERLCRYVARPPLATDRLSRSDDGRWVYRLRHPWRDGTTHVLFEATELVERLAALVPPPRFHTVRYHGILAPAASRRDEVVPGRRPEPPTVDDDGTGPAADFNGSRQAAVAPRGDARSDPTANDRAHPVSRQRRLSWAELMQRVFEIDVLVCPKCNGRLRIMAAVQAPVAIRAILECLGLPSRPPPVAPAPRELWDPPLDADADDPFDED